MNFWAERHGKSECGSHFACIYKWLKQGEQTQNINSTQEAINAIVTGHRNSKRYVEIQTKKKGSNLFVIEYDPDETKQKQVTYQLHLEVCDFQVDLKF